MRTFCDLNLRVHPPKLESALTLLEKARQLGYSVVAVPLPPKIGGDKIRRFKEACRRIDLDFVSRVDLHPQTARRLLSDLRGVRRRFEVIAVACTSKAVARQAAKDRRVDLLTFPVKGKRHFDNSEAELASKGGAKLEICVNPLISLRGHSRIRLLSALRSETVIARKHGVPVVISSGAAESYDLRKPQDLAAPATLFDMPMPEALDAVSVAPHAIVQENRVKLHPSYVAPGIRLVKEGEDCPEK